MRCVKHFFLLLILIPSEKNVAQNYWQHYGLSGKVIVDMAIDDLGNIYAATLGSSGGGILYSPDDGTTWMSYNEGLPDSSAWFIEYIKDYGTGLLVGTVSKGLFKSFQLETNWIFAGLAEWVFEITLNSLGHLFAATGTDGIYRSTDGGIVWTKVSLNGMGSDVYSINTNSSNEIFAGTDSDIFMSTDNGSTWVVKNSGLADYGCYWSIQFNTQGVIFVGAGGGFFTGKGGVYKSANNGEKWILTSMTNRSVNSLLYISDAIFYAATDSGVFVSYDSCNTGNQINNGLDNLQVYSLIKDQRGFLYAGTNSGIFISIEKITSLEVVENSLLPQFNLHQNFPNPFNPSTLIKYSIPQQSNVTLKVFDILGGEVATLVNQEQLQGNFEVEFDGKDLTSGIYFYRIQAGDYLETRKMILLK